MVTKASLAEKLSQRHGSTGRADLEYVEAMAKSAQALIRKWSDFPRGRQSASSCGRKLIHRASIMVTGLAGGRDYIAALGCQEVSTFVKVLAIRQGVSLDRGPVKSA